MRFVTTSPITWSLAATVVLSEPTCRRRLSTVPPSPWRTCTMQPASSLTSGGDRPSKSGWKPLKSRVRSSAGAVRARAGWCRRASREPAHGRRLPRSRATTPLPDHVEVLHGRGVADAGRVAPLADGEGDLGGAPVDDAYVGFDLVRPSTPAIRTLSPADDAGGVGEPRLVRGGVADARPGAGGWRGCRMSTSPGRLHRRRGAPDGEPPGRSRGTLISTTASRAERPAAAPAPGRSAGGVEAVAAVRGGHQHAEDHHREHRQQDVLRERKRSQ
ncbi:hypothetical protein SBADM41S_08480 [Streptomyces badius]